MKFDSRGLEVSTGSVDAIRAIDHYAHELLSLGTDAAAVQAAADANPECAMVQACCASTFLYTQTTVGSKKAAPYLDRAETRLADLTEREQVFIRALKAGCAGDFEGALTLYEQIIDRWPRDVVAAKLAEFHFFQTGLASRQLEVMRKAAAANPDDAEWRAIAPHIRANARDTMFPFLNCIYLYALTRAGETREAGITLDGMERHAEKQTGNLAHVWNDVGVPLARGCVAFASGDYNRASALLQPILNDLACVGGSDEQRGVFAESHLVSLIKAGRKSEARTALIEHIARRPITAVERRWAEMI